MCAFQDLMTKLSCFDQVVEYAMDLLAHKRTPISFDNDSVLVHMKTENRSVFDTKTNLHNKEYGYTNSLYFELLLRMFRTRWKG